MAAAGEKVYAGRDYRNRGIVFTQEIEIVFIFAFLTV